MDHRPRRMKRASLRAVAARAGVSLSTAARVASGSASVRPETRRRVEEAMRELLYVPAEPASPTRTVGLLIPSLENPIFPALAQAIEGRATAAGFAVILCSTAATARQETEYAHMLLERRVDAMIFISCEMTDLRGDHAHYARLIAEGARLLFVNGAIDTLAVPSVGVDEWAAGRIATQHLLDLGHRRIAFAAGPEHYMPTREKAAGMRTALELAGVEEGRVVHTEFTVEGGARALRELAEGPGGPPTGVICSNDLMAIGVMREALRLGLRVPEDLSVVGFDGIEACEWTRPPITTVEQPVEDIAEATVAALGSLVEGSGRLPHASFPPRLRVRRSTAPPRAP